jgi:hypothetical protein
MNLFLLHEDFEQNVRWHVDDHVNKIALEAAQVLSAALWMRQEPGVAYDAATWYQKGLWFTEARRSVHRAYGVTHAGHPMNKWCTDPVNYMWTLRYAIELCKEHQYRKGTVIQQWRMLSQLPRFTVIRSPSIWYAAVADELCTPSELAAGKFVGTDRAIELYRQYYAIHKRHLHEWTKRERPEWIVINP